MFHLFQSWDKLTVEISAANHILLLSDYDGTLTPIVDRPEDAVLSPVVRDKLRALAIKSGFTIGIVSGRSLFGVKAMVNIDGIYYAGNHGFEIEGPSLNFVSPVVDEAHLVMTTLAEQLSVRLEGIAGIIVEDKGMSLSVHYRLVSKVDQPLAADIFQQVTAPLISEQKIRVTTGKKVWEIRLPIDWHKGKAVETVIAELEKVLGGGVGLTIYLGDDTTDEDAFQVIRQRQGWTIFIGPDNSPSSADYFLDSAEEVGTFLTRLLELE